VILHRRSAARCATRAIPPSTDPTFDNSFQTQPFGDPKDC
jgi:hypothetical protein